MRYPWPSRKNRLVNAPRQQPDWALWIMEHGVRILILLAIAFMAFVYTKSRNTTQERLEAIEARVCLLYTSDAADDAMNV